MNNQRKLRFNDVMDLLDDAISELQDIQDEENDAFDALSDRALENGRGDVMEEYIDLMDSAMDQISNVQKFITDSIIKKK